MTENRAWIVERPVTGAYSPDVLRLTTAAMPVPGDGEVLVRTLLLSIDPTTRNWLTLEPLKQFIPFGVGDLMLGANVGVVVESRRAGFAPGDVVRGHWGWADYAIADGLTLEKPPAAGIPDETLLSIFSHVGRAAAMGLLGIAELRDGDTVVVSGAAGATGSIAVQIAKARGNRVIAIAGGAEKVAYLRQIGADATIDHRSEDIERRLRELAPDGVDVCFDNIGGSTLDAMLANMAPGCRIAICGAMSQYDLADPSQAYGIRNLPLLLWNEGTIKGFLATGDRLPEYDAVLRDLYDRGLLRARAHIVEGLEHAAEAVGINYAGTNRGKLMVRVATRVE